MADSNKDNWCVEQNDDYNIDDLLKYKKLPVSKKIDYLDEMNEFLEKLVPQDRQRRWEELKRKGF